MSDYVLSINPCVNPLGSHDPSAVLFEDGDLVYGIEEERLIRQKHATGKFPAEAIEACLDYADIDLADVERVTIPWEPDLFRQALGVTLREAISLPDTIPTRFRLAGWGMRYSLGPWLASTSPIENHLREIGEPVPPIVTHPHHRSHAASAFFPSPFDQALVLTIDGRGEYDATNVWYGYDGGLEHVREYEFPNSWGFLYAAVTKFLGFRPWNGEGKVMGLAPYGSRNSQIESSLRREIDTSANYDVTSLVNGNVRFTIDRLEKILDRSRRKEAGEFTQWEKDLAYTVQMLLEETATNVVEEYCRDLDLRNVALAGGVALNCKMNKRVMELDCVDRTFVQPVAADAGGAVGAGMLEYEPGEIAPMSTVYWGPSYDTAGIEETLQMNKVDYRKVDDVARTVAERLAEGALVGWFQGRLEMGPRALGNRSILADPRTQESLDRVNEFVKHREEWRPFAPSMLERAMGDFVVDPEPAPYMIKTFEVTESARETIPAVLHPADDTTRPQTVREDQNPRYHRLIEEFESITGVPVVLNTSFNDHGEPIVNRPSEGIKDFFGMGLDLLAIEDLVVEK
ncbi:carbamoyltransferase [Halomicroarcula sp. GCM10025324]|uniref:carbamoyltransferase family protein n=1 Tax=Haloarcula TaxID=2237 RepID=UPI0023E816DE|nr:carbamoyltransferase C-terminal domain-containing protein [Halomicroarcula sp. ZS-22-S1]